MASQITGVSIVCASVGSGADQRKTAQKASNAKMFPFDDVIMYDAAENVSCHNVVMESLPNSQSSVQIAAIALQRVAEQEVRSGYVKEGVY